MNFSSFYSCSESIEVLHSFTSQENSLFGAKPFHKISNTIPLQAMSQPSPNSPSETNPTQETGQPQPSAKSHNASKFAKRSLIGLSLVAIVVLLVVGVCNWLPPQMAKWELEEQGVMTDGYGQALLAACEKNDVKTVALLMTAGADVNKADKDGKTPLYKASLYGRPQIVKLLIAAGAKE